MGKEEDSLLMFLSMEKRQDLENGSCDEKLELVKEEQSVRMEEERGGGVVSAHPVFWIYVAATLLVLSLASGAFQFFYPLLQRFCPVHVSYHEVYVVPLRNGGGEALESFFEESQFSELRSSRNEYQGEAIVHDGLAYLTSQHSADEKGVVARSHSVGRLLHSQVFKMKHRGPKPGEETVASFQVTFVFSIENSLAGREATGDGFAFVMVPEGNVMGSAGESLGVMDLDKGETHHTFAVEFDTWKNPSLHDINNNHVGVNVNSMVSLVAKEAGYWSSKFHVHDFHPVDLTSGKIQAWIEYDGMSQDLTVRISPILGIKPLRPLLRRRLDLSKVLNEHMSVGFSAATGDFAAKHIIHSWQFEESSTLQHWHSAMNADHDGVSVQPEDSEDSEGSRKLGFFRDSGLPRDHVSNLPVFRNPHKPRGGDMSTADFVTANVLPTSKEMVETRPLSGMKNCAGYLPNFSAMDFATFKEHFVVNSLWLLLGLTSALLFIHLLFIAYHILLGCYDNCFESSDESLRLVYSRVLDPSEEASDETKYVLVVSESQQYQQEPLDRV